MKVISFNNQGGTSSSSIVESILHILDLARKGEIEGYAIVYHTVEGGVYTSYESDQVSRLVCDATLLRDELFDIYKNLDN